MKNINSGSRMRIIVVSLAALAFFILNAGAAVPNDSMQEYRFSIGEYDLTFSVPKAFIADRWAKPDHDHPEMESLDRGGKRASYFGHTHMFKGPFWSGNYASIDFSVWVYEAEDVYRSPLETLRQMEDYWRWKLAYSENYERYDYAEKTIAGSRWLVMTLVRTDGAHTARRDDENTMLSFPLNNRRFVQVLCRITELAPNNSGRWLADAHVMRDQIIDTIALRKKR